MGIAKSPPVKRSENEKNEVGDASGYMAEGAIPKQKEVERCEVEDSNFGVDTKDAGNFGLGRKGEESWGESTKRRKANDKYEVRLLTKVVAYQGLLQQFSHPQVRADYINNKFGEDDTSFALEALDELRCALFPQWHGGSLDASPENFSSAAVELIKLMTDSQETAPHRSEDATPSSYAEWNGTLRRLAMNPYWTYTAAGKRCTHIMKEFKKSPTNYKLPTFRKNLFSSQKQPLLEKKAHVVVERKIEEIVLSSDSSIDYNPSSSSSTDDSSSDERVAIPRRHKKRVDKREIVTPPIFQMDGKLHLKSFLSTYESFFKSKFIGDSRDKCQQLEQFLTGDLLNVYKICGGRRLKYDQMKERLLAHYKKQKIGGRAYWRKRFEEAAPKPDETLDLFGMRLMELAELAFPKSPKEAAKMLRQTFLMQIPQRIREKISDMEKVMKATSGQKHLNFSAITQLAADLQAELPRSHTIMWSDDLQKHVQSHPDSNNNREPSRGRQFWSQGHLRHQTPERDGDCHFLSKLDKRWQGESPNYWQSNRADHQRRWHSPDVRYNARHRSSSRPWTSERAKNSDSSMKQHLYCSYCGKKNHNQSSCWRAKNACLICGGEHKMKECSRYNPKFSRNEAESSN